MHIVHLKSFQQTVQTLLTRDARDVCLEDEGHERSDSAVYRAPYAARTAVNLLDCRRQLLQEQHGAIGGYSDSFFATALISVSASLMRWIGRVDFHPCVVRRKRERTAICMLWPFGSVS